MKTTHHILYITLLIIMSPATALTQTPVPVPSALTASGSYFILPDTITINAPDTTSYSTELLTRNILHEVHHKYVTYDDAVVTLSINPEIPVETYYLSVTPTRISISASSEQGFIYAAQTLRQWTNNISGPTLTIPCVNISDTPRMPWRCFMLDSGRQFQSPATIKKYIDLASILKMNRFHWHLTEGLGWRPEIKSFPLLTQKGAFVATGPEQQGFYTRTDMTDIVQYAARRGITVVPEIDIPGHSEAALTAYPGLGCFGTIPEIPESGFTQNIFCAGKDSTLAAIRHILDEICEIFPSTYIHLGGDEAPKGNWDKCPDCQQRITRHNLTDSHDLQLWLSAQMARHLKEKGRKAIFWGDVVYRDGYRLPDNCVIQWWNYRSRKELGLRNAISHGYEVICSPNYYTYLNFPVTPWKGYGTERTFDFGTAYDKNPADIIFNEDNPLILGMTCALWTDDGVTQRMIDRRLFPRILALSQQMWHSGTPMPLTKFREIVEQSRQWFESLGYEFGPASASDIDTQTGYWD